MLALQIFHAGANEFEIVGSARAYSLSPGNAFSPPLGDERGQSDRVPLSGLPA
jgi:hypothetical protein